MIKKRVHNNIDIENETSVDSIIKENLYFNPSSIFSPT